jgi:hypothetical protein
VSLRCAVSPLKNKEISKLRRLACALLDPNGVWRLAMSISFPGSSSGFSVSSPISSSDLPQSANLAPKSSQDDSIVQQFLQFAKMTPAQRMFAQMLNKLGISQDEFNAMSPAEQQKVEQKIQQMIKQQVQNNSEKQTGLITDISA